MAQLVTYKGRPVKRRESVVRDGARGLLLTFFAPTPGENGERRFVTDAQWRQFGSVSKTATKVDVRTLAE